MRKLIAASMAFGLVLAVSAPVMADLNQLGQPQDGIPNGFQQGGLKSRSDTGTLAGWTQENGIGARKCEIVLYPQMCEPLGPPTTRQVQG